MFVKLNLCVLGIFALLFFILFFGLSFFGVPNLDKTSNNIVYFLYAAAGVVAAANVQYFLLHKKKGYLELSGEFKPRYSQNSILYQNNRFHAHEDNIEFKAINISRLGDTICNIEPNINNKTPYIIKKSETSESFNINLTPKSGELPAQIEISWIYSISGEKKDRKRKKTLKLKEDADAL